MIRRTENTGMSNIEIEDFLRSNRETRKTFMGVFPSDDLPKKNLRPGESIILNYCGKTSPGCHWLALMRNKSAKSIEVFDSSGLALHQINENIKKFITQHRSGEKNAVVRVFYNRKPLQDFYSSTCGQYAIIFLVLRNMGYSTKKITSLFDSKKLKENDRTVLALFNKIFFPL